METAMTMKVLENGAAALEAIQLVAGEAAKWIAGLDLLVAADRRKRDEQQRYYEPAVHEAAPFRIGPARRLS